MSFDGRVEALINVPSGVTVSATTGSGPPWKLVKNAAGSWDAGVSSVQSIAGDGYVQFVADATTPVSRWLIGFSHTDTDQNFNTIQYGLIIDEIDVTSDMQVYESGVNVFTLAEANADGDVFQVRRTGTTITYWKNGVLRYTSATPTSQTLVVDTSCLNANATVRGVALYDNGTPVNLLWTNVVGVTTTPTAGITATKTLPSGSYFVSGLLSGLASALGSSIWSTSLSTGASQTGRVTLNAAAASWSLAWTSAGSTLRDILGFTADIGGASYPTTANGLASLIGYGTWTSGAGWLFNESAAPAAAAFGSPALALAAGAPVFGNPGPLNSSDFAVSFPAGGAATLQGGNGFNVAAVDDLVVAWVAQHFAKPSTLRTICGKGGGGTPYYGVLADSSGAIYGRANDGTTNYISSANMPTGAYVGILAIDRSTGILRVGVRSLSGTESLGASITVPAVVLANATTGNLNVGAALGVDACESMYLSALYVTTGAGVATGLPANISTALSNFASMFVASAQTGTKQARGLWIPNCPLVLDGEPRRAPKVSDLRTTTSPTGTVLGLVGNTFYRHKNLKWSHVPKSQVWEQAALYANGSWETFFNETQLGLGSTSWFTPCSPVQIYDHTGTALGADANSSAGLANGWQMTGVTSIEPRQSAGTNGWTGMFEIALPEIVSSG